MSINPEKGFILDIRSETAKRIEALEFALAELGESLENVHVEVAALLKALLDSSIGDKDD